MARHILGLVGSYRKGGVVDRLVTETLAEAAAAGATVRKVYLTDLDIAFCTNCRACTQAPGAEPGTCIIRDDFTTLMEAWKGCDGLVLGSPVNFYNVTAVTRRFMERLIGFAYWPWAQGGPKLRSPRKDKRAVLIAATAMPAVLGRLFTGALRALRLMAETMGAKPVASIFVGMIAQAEQTELPARALRQARRAGRRLAAG